MHTPTPWKHITGNLIRDSHGNCIAGDSTAVRNPDNAALIVQAVNHHQDLVDVLKLLCAQVMLFGHSEQFKNELAQAHTILTTLTRKDGQ